jgi:hypothetical protein
MSSLRRALARRSLRPHLNQIRSWVRQGRTDAWIAHQLEVTVQQIQSFKRENELAPDADAENGRRADFDDEIDLRAEDDALIAAELEAAEAARAEEDARPPRPTTRPPRRRRRATSEPEAAPPPRPPWWPPPPRRCERCRLEGTFDHGEEGYGLWLDPAVADNPCTPSTGRATVPSRSRSRRTRS